MMRPAVNTSAHSAGLVLKPHSCCTALTSRHELVVHQSYLVGPLIKEIENEIF